MPQLPRFHAPPLGGRVEVFGEIDQDTLLQGVQVLTAFLIILPFSDGFARLDQIEEPQTVERVGGGSCDVIGLARDEDDGSDEDGQGASANIRLFTDAVMPLGDVQSRFATEVLAPTNSNGDLEGCTLSDGAVRTLVGRGLFVFGDVGATFRLLEYPVRASSP